MGEEGGAEEDVWEGGHCEAAGGGQDAGQACAGLPALSRLAEVALVTRRRVETVVCFSRHLTAVVKAV